MIKFQRFAAFLLLIALLAIPKQVLAQDNPAGPTYTIQSGDTLGVIASKFGVSVDDIIAANKIENPNVLSAGQQIIIPGLEGVTGNLTAETIPLGANLASLSIQHQFPLNMLAKLNKVTSPIEIYAGSSLILPVSNQTGLKNVMILKPEESFLEAAVQLKANPWLTALQNNLGQTWQAVPSQPLYFASNPNDAAQPVYSMPFLSGLQFNELPVVQGHTIEISAAGDQGLQISGKLSGYDLHFFPAENGRYIALQGIYAMTDPGLASFELNITKPDSSSYQFSQMVYVQSGFYPEDPPLTVDPITIDPANTKPEEDQIKNIVTPVTTQKLWNGMFKTPVDEPICYASQFGFRRSYNGGPYSSFHGGLDYRVCAPSLNIYAPAAGMVVFTGPLTVRGNATVIDHGLGVYTGYWHQSEIKVKTGDHVEPGQLIGLIGGTGRVTGPHLHWEIWVDGVQVNPTQWLEKTYP
jgi:murein DD-endopeptidase MepM/ murein hydrolase activator NlpD